jgi:hypothetical protein
MGSKEPFYFGNAEADQVSGSGWFVGQFVPAELGLRRQTAVELKWGIHPDGEKRPQPWANQNGATIAVLIEGGLKVTFHVDGSQQEVTLQTKGDYVIFGPEVVHSWEAIGDTIVLSVRFPSVEVGSREPPPPYHAAENRGEGGPPDVAGGAANRDGEPESAEGAARSPRDRAAALHDVQCP